MFMFIFMLILLDLYTVLFTLSFTVSDFPVHLWLTLPRSPILINRIIHKDGDQGLFNLGDIPPIPTHQLLQ